MRDIKDVQTHSILPLPSVLCRDQADELTIKCSYESSRNSFSALLQNLLSAAHILILYPLAFIYNISNTHAFID